MTIETLKRNQLFRRPHGLLPATRLPATTASMQFSGVRASAGRANGEVPVLTFLSGLTCTEENFMVKSGAQRVAAELGLMLVSPDTSPRGRRRP